jgi:hypothetical protein
VNLLLLLLLLLLLTLLSLAFAFASTLTFILAEVSQASHAHPLLQIFFSLRCALQLGQLLAAKRSGKWRGRH